MALVRSRARHIIDLTGGGQILPDEQKNIDTSPPHEQALLAQGALVLVDPTVAPTPRGPYGGWRDPVVTVNDLPATGNLDGDTRIAVDTLSMYAWKDGGWQPLAPGVTTGGGGGGVAAPVNLFVGPTQPDTSGLLVDALWIKTLSSSDGTPKGITAWEVYTGTGDGGGGNVFVQETLPTPLVTALWVPTNPDGSAKYIDQWQVLAGAGGTPPAVRNSNVFIQKALPANPPAGSLFIPLNTDGSAKTPDQWRVFA